MIDVQKIREQPDAVRAGIQKKGLDGALVDRFLEIDAAWRKQVQKIEISKAALNKLSQERNITAARAEKTKIKDQEGTVKALETDRLAILRLIPNLPLAHVPAGGAADSVVIRTVGEKPKFDFPPQDHLALGEALDIIDVKRAAKVSGTRFGYLKGAGALLEFAMFRFAIDLVTKKGFTFVVPPVLVKKESMAAMGYIERGAEEIYTTQDDLVLVGTSEQSIGPMHMNETFNESDLPKRYVAFSPCFRREAGSHGQDTRGILRLHQFNKLEMLSFTTPADASAEHELFLNIEEDLMCSLALPFQVLNIAAGDLGDPTAAKYDIEAWLPGQNHGAGRYRETHSTSNTTDFQARRLNIKYRAKSGSAFVHMVNGTAFSDRPLIAILENYQQADGSIKVPTALVPYTGFEVIQANV